MFDLFSSVGMELESDKKKREQHEEQKISQYEMAKKSIYGDIETLENAEGNEEIRIAKGLLEEADYLADLGYLSEEERIQGVGLVNLDNAKAKLDEAKRIVQQEILKAKPKNSPTTSSSKQKPKSEQFKVNMDTRIIYRPDEIFIAELFSPEEVEKGIAKEKDGKIEYSKIDEAQIKVKLEERYAELIPNYTHLVWMKEKNVIGVVLQGQKKGLEEGICIEVGSSIEDSSLLTPVLPIPFSVLEDFVVIANHFHQKFGVEVRGDIYFEFDKNEFFLDIPGQRVSRVIAEMNESGDELFMRFWDKNAKKVMEIHSHHAFHPCPSETDNRGERSPGMLYGIVGTLNDSPTFTCRTFHKEWGHISLDPLEIFEYTDGFNFQKSIDCYDLTVVEVKKYE